MALQEENGIHLWSLLENHAVLPILKLRFKYLLLPFSLADYNIY